MENENKKKRMKRPRGYKRSKEQQDYDIMFCSNLFLKGYTYREIAKQLNEDLAKRGMNYTICFQMVYYDIQNQLIQWKKERMDNIDDYITQELRKLDKIEVELWDAWNNSKTGKQRLKERKTGRPLKVDLEHNYSETSVESSAGNPRFLDLLLNVQQRRAKMLGFDAPIKIDMPNMVNINNDAPKYNIGSVPDELLFQVADKLQSEEYKKILIEKGQLPNDQEKSKK